MELLDKNRLPIRANFTKSYITLTNLLTEDNLKEENSKSIVDSLKRIYDCFVKCDNDISNNLLEDPEFRKIRS